MTARFINWLARAALSAGLLVATSPAAIAESYPARTVRIIVPFAAGGPADLLGRVLAERLHQAWGQPVIVENVGGAGGNVGAGMVARAPADGYTLLLNASSHIINASLYDNLPYDAIKDFSPVSEVASYMLVLVLHPSVPAATLPEFVAYARAKEGGVTVANAGTGTPTHLAAVLFAEAAGLNFLHVPYRGAAPATTDLMAGHAAAMFDNPVNAIPQAKAGNLKGIAVTGSKRLALVPELPTVAEAGYRGFETRTWYGFFGPANMPKEIVAKINADTKTALRAPEVSEKLVAQGWDIVTSTPEDFAPVLRAETT